MKKRILAVLVTAVLLVSMFTVSFSASAASKADLVNTIMNDTELGQFEHVTTSVITQIDNFNFTVNLLVYNPEKISEILNMLKDKNYHKEEFTIDDYALALQCLIHARKPYAEDVIVDLVNIFQSIDYISPNCQNELSSSLIVAIKYHFKDDIEKSRRLITMIVKAMDKGGFGELPGLVNDKLEIMKHEKINSELKRENSELKRENSQKDEEISEKEEENSSLKDENAKLKEENELLKNKLENKDQDE